MTRLMRQAAREMGADWIVPLDADEFLKCGDRLPLPPADHPNAYWKIGFATYCVDAEDDAARLNPVERMGHRLAREPMAGESLEERRYLLKALVPRKTALQDGAYLVQGNHHLQIANTDPPHGIWEEFVFAHYSLRSPGQYASKIAITYLQHLYKSSPRAGLDSFYVPFVERLKKDFAGFARDFPSYRPAYLLSYPDFDPSCVRDPLVYRGASLRYTQACGDFTLFASNLLGYAETLARSLASHAEAHESETQTSEQGLKLLLHQPQAPADGQDDSRFFTLRDNLPKTAYFTLVPAGSLLELEWQGAEALVDIVSLRWRNPETDSWTAWTSEMLRSRLRINQNAVLAHHSQYFSFFKGHDPARIACESPGAQTGEMEITFWIETHPSRVATRLFQDRNFDQIIQTGAANPEFRHREAQYAAQFHYLREQLQIRQDKIDHCRRQLRHQRQALEKQREHLRKLKDKLEAWNSWSGACGRLLYQFKRSFGFGPRKGNRRDS